jgi:hypothetical protein
LENKQQSATNLCAKALSDAKGQSEDKQRLAMVLNEKGHLQDHLESKKYQASKALDRAQLQLKAKQHLVKVLRGEVLSTGI